jgi:uncharacterized protein YbcI
MGVVFAMAGGGAWRRPGWSNRDRTASGLSGRGEPDLRDTCAARLEVCGTLEDRTREPGPVDPDPRPEASPPTQRSVESQIRGDILAIHEDSYGRSAGDTKAHVIDDTVIVILDDLELLPNEEYLIEHGRADAVKNLREQFQHAIRPTFAAAVERATGRRVVGFASHAQLEGSRFAIEIFRLGRPREE